MQTTDNILLSLPTSADQAQVLMEELIALAVPWTAKAVGALLILVFGLFFAGWVKRTVKKLMNRTDRIDPLLTSFLSSLIYYATIAVVIIMVLANFGVQTTSLAALLGAAGLAVGLAMQGTLGHVASGVMLLAFRPFDVGDYVIAGGEEGTIKGITLFTTEMATADNKKIIMPNGRIWDHTITNFSANQKRRLDMTFGISYNDDIGKVMEVLNGVITTEPRIDANPKPVVAVNNLGDYSIDFTVRLWLDGSDYLSVKWDMNRAVKEAFDEAGITIPYPTAIRYEYPVAD